MRYKTANELPYGMKQLLAAAVPYVSVFFNFSKVWLCSTDRGCQIRMVGKRTTASLPSLLRVRFVRLPGTTHTDAVKSAQRTKKQAILLNVVKSR